jgi:hypothetical protein
VSGWQAAGVALALLLQPFDVRARRTVDLVDHDDRLAAMTDSQRPTRHRRDVPGNYRPQCGHIDLDGWQDLVDWLDRWDRDRLRLDRLHLAAIPSTRPATTRRALSGPDFRLDPPEPAYVTLPAFNPHSRHECSIHKKASKYTQKSEQVHSEKRATTLRKASNYTQKSEQLHSTTTHSNGEPKPAADVWLDAHRSPAQVANVGTRRQPARRV